ncbi:hypothetical protein D934_01480 [Xylella fastidiosa subsp. sandyi Ann-1]|uniref:Uncharacterized protein n=1 Tax=Xylella fastidiosa subsp. sandyi Ann-1 TaxID=155920 RepID=A0A060H6Q7_XYLFS|nr:hypothetical protein D934_01480 [Xylella fastidiosa subsp. sandyi Ann-1]
MGDAVLIADCAVLEGDSTSPKHISLVLLAQWHHASRCVDYNASTTWTSRPDTRNYVLLPTLTLQAVPQHRRRRALTLRNFLNRTGEFPAATRLKNTSREVRPIQASKRHAVEMDTSHHAI